MKRREAIKLLGLTGAWLAGCARPGTAGSSSQANKDSSKRDEMAHIVILHTNDLHGHLLGWRGWEGALKGKMIGGAARLATAIVHARKDAPESNLLLDAGDLIGDTMIADLTKGEALIKVFNHLNYDALTFGNHEPDFGIGTLRERMKEAEFPFVAANLVTKDGAEPFAAPFVLKKLDGITVGLLGLTYPKTPWTTAKKNVAEVTFQDPIETAERELPKLRAAGAELVVVISHLGLSGDQKLAQAVEGIDVIVGGHSHNRMEVAEKRGGTPPRWKMAIVTWLGVFPAVLFWSWLLSTRLYMLHPIAITILVVASLTWAIMPRLTGVLRPWLNKAAGDAYLREPHH